MVGAAASAVGVATVRSPPACWSASCWRSAATSRCSASVLAAVSRSAASTGGLSLACQAIVHSRVIAAPAAAVSRWATTGRIGERDLAADDGMALVARRGRTIARAMGSAGHGHRAVVRRWPSGACWPTRSSGRSSRRKKSGLRRGTTPHRSPIPATGPMPSRFFPPVEDCTSCAAPRGEHGFRFPEGRRRAVAQPRGLRPARRHRSVGKSRRRSVGVVARPTPAPPPPHGCRTALQSLSPPASLTPSRCRRAPPPWRGSTPHPSPPANGRAARSRVPVRPR